MYMRLGKYEQPNAQTSLYIRTVLTGPLLLSYAMQMDGGIKVSLHKIYVSVSILNKTFVNMRVFKVSCAGPYLVLRSLVWCVWGHEVV